MISLCRTISKHQAPLLLQKNSLQSSSRFFSNDMKGNNRSVIAVPFAIRKLPDPRNVIRKAESDRGNNTTATDDLTVEKDVIPKIIVEEVDSNLLDPAQVNTNTGNRSLFLGVVLTIALVLVWLTGAAIHKDNRTLFSSSSDFSFIARYINQTSYTALLPFCWFLRRREQRKTAPASVSKQKESNINLRNAAVSAAVYFMMGLTWMESLPRTSFSLNTSLYSTYMPFVFILSALFLEEDATTLKVVSVLIAGCGSILLGYQGAFDEQNTIEGILLVILAAMLYAVYQVGYAKWIAEDAQTPTQVLEWTGLIGVAMVLASPLVATAGISSGYLQPETIDLFLHNHDVHMYLLASCGTTLGVMVLLLLAIYYSSPLLSAAGSVMTIPASFIVQFLSTGKVPSTLEVEGSALIALSFVCLTIAMRQEDDEKKKD